jgi:hypothetical protein
VPDKVPPPVLASVNERSALEPAVTVPNESAVALRLQVELGVGAVGGDEDFEEQLRTAARAAKLRHEIAMLRRMFILQSGGRVL